MVAQTASRKRGTMEGYTVNLGPIGKTEELSTPDDPGYVSDKQKAMDSLLEVVRVWIDSGIGPKLMKISIPSLGVSVTFKGKRLTIEAF